VSGAHQAISLLTPSILGEEGPGKGESTGLLLAHNGAQSSEIVK